MAGVFISCPRCGSKKVESGHTHADQTKILLRCNDCGHAW